VWYQDGFYFLSTLPCPSHTFALPRLATTDSHRSARTGTLSFSPVGVLTVVAWQGCASEGVGQKDRDWFFNKRKISDQREPKEEQKMMNQKYEREL